MREIKFRAWHKTNLGHPVMCNWRELCLGFNMRTFEDHDNFELMQFTGLKDKNGKEIYEGDIVQGETISWACDNYCLDCEYEGNDSTPSTCEKKSEYHKGIVEWDKNELKYSFPNVHLSTIEVIGNIHEDKKLNSKGG